ncbi:hypothetical protein M2284_004374 [Rhodococcus sp. LBL1]|nr:hypothetical protein [Rhodococcus sp. LBL1]MDH6685577.1 hypothetical protein [Rhodococcus sp. LBL2]
MAVHDGAEMLGPPFSAELLADLHAGVLPEDVSARLWPLVRQDSDALAVLDALDAVSARLGEVGRDHSIGTPVPPEIAARINSALEQQDAGSAGVVTSLTDAPSRRRMATWMTVAVAATAAAVALVFALTGLDDAGSTAPEVIATPTSTTSGDPVADLGSDLDGNQVLALVHGAKGGADVGRLADPQVRGACLQANGIEPTTPVLGTRAVRFRGGDAVLMLVAGPHPPALTALVVGADCDATTPDLLTQAEIG